MNEILLPLFWCYKEESPYENLDSDVDDSDVVVYSSIYNNDSLCLKDMYKQILCK